MSEGRPAPQGRAPARREDGDEARTEAGEGDAPGAGRPTIDVRPEDVWQAGPPPPPPRWAQRSFFAPILGVVAISALLLYGVLALGGALWAWLR